MSTSADVRYQAACQLVEAGDYQQAAARLRELETDADTVRLRSLIMNDLGVLNMLVGDAATARLRLESAVQIDPGCEAARLNLLFIDREMTSQRAAAGSAVTAIPDERRGKVALISFLFNWPSTGGGIVHTVELARFLTTGGYEVKLFYPRFAPWSLGRVADGCPFPGQALDFETADWSLATIQERFRRAVDDFSPDWVIVTDCWNFKPHMAHAMRGYSRLLRMQAHECLCPLNNLRLLPGEQGGFRQCPHHQLAHSDACGDCVRRFSHTSGDLHRAERELSRVGTPEYGDRLLQSLQDVDAVLVLNPLIAESFRPYCRRVEVVTWGMDARRFPWPPPKSEQPQSQCLKRLLFAGLAGEAIKGFPVVHAACARLWERRQDFELAATTDPAGAVDAYTRFIGWQSQENLPECYRNCDICVVPTIAQDGLSRTAVEAMASGRPVIASRIGGLPFTVDDGINGLLCEPSDVTDWAEKIDRLLTDDRLRGRMGDAGRRTFDEQYRWEIVVENSYRPLLEAIRQQGGTG